MRQQSASATAFRSWSWSRSGALSPVPLCLYLRVWSFCSKQIVALTVSEFPRCTVISKSFIYIAFVTELRRPRGVLLVRIVPGPIFYSISRRPARIITGAGQEQQLDMKQRAFWIHRVLHPSDVLRSIIMFPKAAQIINGGLSPHQYNPTLTPRIPAQSQKQRGPKPGSPPLPKNI